MDLTNLIISLIILTETTLLCLRSSKKHFINPNQKRKVYVDTSALMDPRLLAVAQTGFIGDEIIIPRSVIHELQLLADGKDHDKRLRARAGLDTVRELERVVHFNTEIIDDALDYTPVDNRLLDLAKSNHGLILTNDYNLGKVAATDHIDVLSLNELALVLRNEYLPGEHAQVKIVAVGSGPNQGVAYLKDGTMVVVDRASHKLGEEVEVVFERLNQTAAGSMMFARLAKSGPAKTKSSTQSNFKAPVQNNPKISLPAKTKAPKKNPRKSRKNA